MTDPQRQAQQFLQEDDTWAELASLVEKNSLPGTSVCACETCLNSHVRQEYAKRLVRDLKIGHAVLVRRSKQKNEKTIKDILALLNTGGTREQVRKLVLQL